MKIDIENLSFKCIIGILKFERVKKQRVIMNLSFDYEFKDEEFIDYSKVVKLVKKTMKEKKFLLLENAIEELSNILYSSYKITNLKIKIAKPNILKDCIVSLSS